MSTEFLVFNGVNASSGDYLMPPMTPQEVSALAQGEEFDPRHLDELKWRYRQATESHLGVKAGVDPRNLAETGWGVIFAHGADLAIREALGELLDHRREQATKSHEHYYKEYTGAGAYRPGESKDQFLARHGAAPGPVDPDNVPYYLLIVGDPAAIPYDFQHQLDVAYAVGRIHFESLDEYAQYARSVVDSETGQLALPRRAVFFGVENADDRATSLSAQRLVAPLAEKLAGKQQRWAVDTVLGDGATKARLGRLLGGEETPALLFTASHGVCFDLGDPRQLHDQGALLCQDWPGPRSRGMPLSKDYYLAADDVADTARLLGLLAFHFACYGAGTPERDDFAHRLPGVRERGVIAPHAFVAGLPKRLLGHPKGGALAVVGHVERAWGTSFMWEGAGAQLAVFESTLEQLMDGYPVGAAIEFFNERYAELSTSLSAQLYDIRFGKMPDDLQLSTMWTANNDARGYAVLGDPAVRLPVGDTVEMPAERPMIVAVKERVPVPERTGVSEETPAAGDAAILEAGGHSEGGVTAPTGAATAEFGVIGDARASLAHALQQFLYKVGAVLERTVRDVGSLEVATYVSDNMAEVKYAEGRFSGGAKLRALTHIKVDGDTLVCVPEKEGELDEALWAVHTAMVERAQANRVELLKTAVSSASTLLEAFKTL